MSIATNWGRYSVIQIASFPGTKTEGKKRFSGIKKISCMDPGWFCYRGITLRDFIGL
jgi:hypothetical protein